LDKVEKSLLESLSYVRDVRSFSFLVSRARFFIWKETKI